MTHLKFLSSALARNPNMGLKSPAPKLISYVSLGKVESFAVSLKLGLLS